MYGLGTLGWVQGYYDSKAIKLFVSRAIEGGGRGTQSQLGKAVGVPQSTVNKWTQKQTCPSPEFWSGIEAFFEMEPGTIAGVGGIAPATVSDVESAILAADELGEDEKDVLLRMYHVVIARQAFR